MMPHTCCALMHCKIEGNNTHTASITMDKIFLKLNLFRRYSNQTRYKQILYCIVQQ